MTTIYVERPFLLKLDNGAQRSFAVGEQEVDQSDCGALVCTGALHAKARCCA